jgi:hypothetical protein
MKPGNGGDQVFDHWYTLVAGEHFSSAEFYERVEKELAAQKLPGLGVSRVDLSEGGPLSDKREYLRMQRERLRFDVCAAPVGVNYFFSYRFYALPAVVAPWEMFIFLLTLSTAFYLGSRFMGFFLGPVVLVALLLFLAWMMRSAVGLGLRDLDATLLRVPVVAPIYERYFRKDTYYRQDMRIAYGSIVSAIVRAEAERLTSANGVKLLRSLAYSPLFDGLYKPRTLSQPSEPAAA